jgi:YVTN family beta-propeller protein
MKHTLNIFVVAMLFVGMVSSCKKSDDPEVTPVGPYANGAFISNEGTFGLANASVSFYDFAGDSVRNSIYSVVNNHPLGQVLQSVYLSNGFAYMMMNLSDTVVVTTADDFKDAGTITGLSSPRYMTSFNNKGYITQWGENGVVKVVDLSLRTILKTIDVGTGPEQAIVAGGKILVCNGGAYTVDSTISVIDPANDNVVQTVEVGYNPKEMVVDKNNDIWVICYGYIKYDSNFQIVLERPSKLVKLSGQSFQKTEFVISKVMHPQHIDISSDKSTVYFGGGYGFTGIYAMSITDNVLPTAPIIGTKMFYGFNVNPANGEIFALDATDYTGPGILYRYSAQGNLIKQYSTGVAPNGVAFK